MFPSLGYFEDDEVFPYTESPSVSLSTSAACRTEPPCVGGQCSCSHLDFSTRSLIYWIFLRWYRLRSGFHPASFLLHTFQLASVPYNEWVPGPKTISLLGLDLVSAILRGHVAVDSCWDYHWLKPSHLFSPHYCS